MLQSDHDKMLEASVEPVTVKPEKEEVDDRIAALAQLLDCATEDLWLSKHDNQTVVHDDEEYLVLTDSEADEKWEEALENYIDECIIPEIPDPYKYYFDREKWTDDAKGDGRGHSLSTYDGEEQEETVDGVDYYIYRTN